MLGFIVALNLFVILQGDGADDITMEKMMVGASQFYLFVPAIVLIIILICSQRLRNKQLSTQR